MAERSVVPRELLRRWSMLHRGRQLRGNRLYQAMVDYWPDFLNYEKNTGRSFPVVRLTEIETS